MLKFLAPQGMNFYPNQYTLEGKPLSTNHSTGLVTALAASPDVGKPFVLAVWDARIPQGKWRYYDGLLYLMGLLHAGGQFRIYAPE